MARTPITGINIDGAPATVEFETDADNVVTTIWIANALPVAVRVIIHHAESGYDLDSEFVLTAPISINIPPPRRFPDDNTARVAFSTQVRTVT